jgi:conjugal transfer pilus assembly protein TraB
MLNIKLIKYKQILLALYLVVATIGMFAFIIKFLNRTPVVPITDPPKHELNILTAGKRITAEEVWRDQMHDVQENLNKDLSTLKGNFMEQQAVIDKKFDVVDNMINSIAATQNDEIKNIEADFVSNQSANDVNQVMRVNINLTPKNKNHKTLDNTIPAGSFAKAILLSGVDALTAISAQANPIPILARIVDYGNLPMRFKSDLRDCRVMASSYGDLASERVHARLETLSCVERSTHEIIETQIAGVIVGSDGKEGIRGSVVSKDAAFIGRSLWGSIFSGIGNVLSPLNQHSSNISLLPSNNQNQMSSGDLFKSGMAEGSSKALDRVSKYYIERAEQLQPIIQINAGQKVDLIFSAGAFIGSAKVKEEIAKSRHQSRINSATANWESQS